LHRSHYELPDLDISLREAGTAAADRKFLILAAGARAAAEDFAERQSLSAIVITRDEVGLSVRRLRELVRDYEIGAIAVHTPDWSRQLNPQVYELMLVFASVGECYLADDASATFRRLGRAELTARAARVPAAVFTGLTETGLEAVRSLLPRRRGRPRLVHVSDHGEKAVLAIWVANPLLGVGGSVTHISGILKGFRSAGFRIGLVALEKPPEQLRTVIDDLEVVPALPARARLTSDVQGVLLNRAVSRSGRLLANRLRPRFVYQRHRSFLLSGASVAKTSGAAFVLEWNGSAVWSRAADWTERLPIERPFDPLLARNERSIVRSADLVVAVSAPAAAAAIAAGSQIERTVVVPNGVDFDRVDACTKGQERADRSRPRIGWIGSFGPWHGAEVLIRALSVMPAEVELVMIGDGSSRTACHSLAEQLGVSSRIEWAGALPHCDALRRLVRCDLLASPHTPLPDQEFFGSPTKIFEYMALGRPIVASALGQIAEVLEDGRTARLVPPGDVRALADAVVELLTRADRGAALGRAARSEARRRHTWEDRAQNVLDALQRNVTARALVG
jgi:glycosyltransferase involved in cell wall biosynthesis